MDSPIERSCRETGDEEESDDDGEGEPGEPDFETPLYLDDEDDETPRIPTAEGQPRVVDYNVRVPGDWVVSGPLPGYEGPGRAFISEEAAFGWAQWKYGAKRVSKHYGGPGRWAVVVRPE